MSSLRRQITDAYARDGFCLEILEYLRAPSDAALWKLTPRVRSRIERYSLDDDLLTFSVDRFDVSRIVVPLDEDLCARLLHEYHDSPSGGYLGREKSSRRYRVTSTGPTCANRSASGCARAKPTSA